MFKSSHRTHTAFRRFLGDDNGATAIEYALIASGVSIVIVGTVATLGSQVTGMFTSVATALK
ncbi:MAG: Flp family type IVb pilin [Xanthobacteraceae bacterium]|nr:Flp family type IVb pilin [Xanthobacteraceae bacterium]